MNKKLEGILNEIPRYMYKDYKLRPHINGAILLDADVRKAIEKAFAAGQESCRCMGINCNKVPTWCNDALLQREQKGRQEFESPLKDIRHSMELFVRAKGYKPEEILAIQKLDKLTQEKFGVK